MTDSGTNLSLDMKMELKLSNNVKWYLLGEKRNARIRIFLYEFLSETSTLLAILTNKQVRNVRFQAADSDPPCSCKHKVGKPSCNSDSCEIRL